jgi:hypothetical protein
MLSTPVVHAGSAAIPWYLQGGVAATNCLAAYQAIGAASLAASYTNLANPGTYDLSGGTAPDWAGGTGWTFNGSSQYKDTGINPAANATQGWSIICRYSGVTATGGIMIGGYATGYFGLTTRTMPMRRYYNPNVVSYTGVLESYGVMCVAGLNGYFDGVLETGSPFAWADFDCGSIQLGMVNNLWWAGSIQAAAIYDTVLSAAQVLAISNAMEQLPIRYDAGNPAYPGPALPESGEFTVAFFSDSHVGSAISQNEIATITAWLSKNKTRRNIQAVLHGGDYADSVAHSDDRAAFAAALASLAGIPHLLAMGNHDYDTADGPRNSAIHNSVFGPSYYLGMSWWSGDFCKPTKSENQAILLTIGAVDYIFIVLEWFPREDVIDWADLLLGTYSARKAIIITHAYEYNDASPYTSGDSFGPDSQTEITDADYHWGNEMWTELLNIHDNVIAILSGHVGGVVRHVANSAGGQPVHQMLFNNQSDPAYDTTIRFMRINPTTETIYVESFSPVTKTFNTNGENKFTITY